jgi:hypothetical protein
MTAVGVALGFAYGGAIGVGLVLILGILEVSLSFDNAVINATVLERMSAYWQRMFLTVGVLIAVFGMRLLFPLVTVAVSAHLSPVQAIALASEKGDPDLPGTYGYILRGAHPSIAAFGGMFLLMIFLSFVFEERDVRWLRWLEAPLAKVGRLDYAAIIVALGTLGVVSQVVANTASRERVLFAGLIGLATYLLISALGGIFEGSSVIEVKEHGSIAKAAGKAAFFLFLYLEVLDASFSFDGVIGAFAITSDPILIAIGLGVGAFYIRSFTIYLVRRGTLKEFVFLESGAMWAIGALATILLITIRWEVPQLVTGLVGIVFIGAGFVSSVARNRKVSAQELRTNG